MDNARVYACHLRGSIDETIRLTEDSLGEIGISNAKFEIDIARGKCIQIAYTCLVSDEGYDIRLNLLLVLLSFTYFG